MIDAIQACLPDVDSSFELDLKVERLPVSEADKEMLLKLARLSNASEKQILPSTESLQAETIPVDMALCFVIMSFSGDRELEDFYEQAVKPTVESFGYTCQRVDEQEFNGSIRDRILANIKRARFVIADLTGAPQLLL